MHAHFVLAHPEPRSFNAAMVRAGAAALEAAGWSVSVSDIYALDFDPREAPQFFEARADPERLDVQAAQRHARSEEHTSELQSLMRTSYAVFCLNKNYYT